MDPLSVFGLIQAGGSLLGNVVGNIFGSASQQKLTKENMLNAKELADYQYYLQQKQFDYTNKYNLPANQVKRLIQADLNPNLAYSSGSVVGSTASMPSVSQPHANMSDPMALAQYQLQMSSMFKDLVRQSYEIAKTKADIKNINADTEGKEIENENKLTTQDSYKRLQEALARERGYMADIAQDNALKNKYDLIAKRDLHNVQQLVLRGDDGDFFFDYMSDSQRESYLRDLKESDLYNSVKALWERDSLNVLELRKKIKLIEGEIKRLPDMALKLHGDALVSEFRGNLAKLGINPDDPLWMRLTATAINKIFDWLGDDPIKAVQKIRPFGGIGKTPTHEDPYLDW